MLQQLSVLLIALTAAQAQSSGNTTDRLALCNTLHLPGSFTQYLNTTFLGPRRFIEAGPVNYTYFQFGPLNTGASGRNLIMVAGQGATATIWTPDLLQTLAQARQVTIFTNKGLGLSTDAATPYASTVADYAESTSDLIEALGLEQPDILGWSLGGFITLTLAEEYPEVVNKVVVADTSSGGLEGYSAESRSLLQLITPTLTAGQPLPPTYIFPDTNAGNTAMCNFIASISVMPQEPVTSQQIAGQNNAIFEYANDPESLLFHGLGNITAPTLVIAGSQDMIISVQDDDILIDKIPGASLLQFADAGHAAILQHAVTAGQIISAFLDASHN